MDIIYKKFARQYVEIADLYIQLEKEIEGIKASGENPPPSLMMNFTGLFMRLENLMGIGLKVYCKAPHEVYKDGETFTND